MRALGTWLVIHVGRAKPHCVPFLLFFILSIFKLNSITYKSKVSNQTFKGYMN